MRLHTAHRRHQRKTQRPRFSKAAMRRFEICNRFAVTREAKTIITTRLNIHGYRMSFQTYFYALKDAILARYGQPAGYALQTWRSGWDDWDYGYDPTACLHQHVLRCVRLRGRIFHVPTGAFDFMNFVSDYGRSGGNFSFYRTLCTRTIEGKKQVSRPPNVTSAKAALIWLEKRFSRLPQADRQPRHLVAGTYEQAAWLRYQAECEAQAQRRREAWLERQRNTPNQCRWCLQIKTMADFTKRNDHICDVCAPIAEGQGYVQEELEEIPF